MVKFFINFLAAAYGLIGFFSIIPFLIVFLLGPSLSQVSENDMPVYAGLLVLLGGSSLAGILIVYWVNQLSDLGRKVMIGYNLSLFSLLLGTLWRGRVGSKILTVNNDIALGVGLLIIFGTICFLFHPKVKQFFL